MEAAAAAATHDGGRGDGVRDDGVQSPPRVRHLQVGSGSPSGGGGASPRPRSMPSPLAVAWMPDDATKVRATVLRVAGAVQVVGAGLWRGWGTVHGEAAACVSWVR